MGLSMLVAPHAGAWIETTLQFQLATNQDSVAPHAGAWIETDCKFTNSPGFIVAPHAGAWIETSVIAPSASLLESLPTRERGLKQ